MTVATLWLGESHYAKAGRVQQQHYKVNDRAGGSLARAVPMTLQYP